MDLTYNELHLLIVALERSNRKKKWNNDGDSYVASVLLKRLRREQRWQAAPHGGVYSNDPVEWR